MLCNPIAFGSRPASSAWRRMASIDRRPVTEPSTRLASQPSPYRPTRRYAASEFPPIQIGRGPPRGGLCPIPPPPALFCAPSQPTFRPPPHGPRRPVGPAPPPPPPPATPPRAP